MLGGWRLSKLWNMKLIVVGVVIGARGRKGKREIGTIQTTGFLKKKNTKESVGVLRKSSVT